MPPNKKIPGKSKTSLAEIRIKNANVCDNVLNEIEVDQFKIDDQQLRLNCYKSSELTGDQFDLMLQLTEDNMKEFYEQSSWGWSRESKLKEFQHKSAIFLVLENVDQLIAFCHLRFEYGTDDYEACVYCYELQVLEEYRGKGVGKYLMNILSLLADHFQIHKVMLTVFKHNPIAMNFYFNALKFKIDKSSPSKFDQVFDYEILSLKKSKFTK